MLYYSLSAIQVQPYTLPDDGVYPGNPNFPVLFYADAVQFKDNAPEAALERLFSANGWTGWWTNGIYDYHHYHSISHEVLGVYAGEAQVQIGGPHGVILPFRKGDVMLIPAGVAHKCISSTADFGVVGAYPPGQENYDVLYGLPDERPAADGRIVAVPLPETDPVYGENGVMAAYWNPAYQHV